MTTSQIVALLAGLLAGAINAFAGGGGLVVFPALLGLGLDPVTASATATMVMVPGFIGTAIATRKDLVADPTRARRFLVAGAVGGAAGAVALSSVGVDQFRSVVPWMLVAACVAILGQERIRRLVMQRRKRPAPAAVVLVGAATLGIYGGFFGAGLGVMSLAWLGVTMPNPPGTLNNFKTLISLGVNVAATSYLVTTDLISWRLGAPMAIAAFLGGLMAGNLTVQLPAQVLRSLVCATSIGLTVVYLVI